MTEKNYYEILGVDKKASEDDIKKAYRKLVRKYHPDVSKDPDADKKMGEINNAYETLKDSQKRTQYDAMLDNPFKGQGGFGGFNGFNNTQNMSQEDLDDILRHFGGASGFGGFNGSEFGGGQASGFGFDDLFGAFGNGRFNNTQHNTKGEDITMDMVIDLQDSYDGGAKKITLSIPMKHGIETIYENKTIEVKIPKGITTDQKIRLSGKGNPSPYGGKQGDLYLVVKFAQSEKYQIEEKNVTQTVDICPWEAVFGGEITVQTPAGKVNVNIPKNSKNGTKLRLKGKGIPAKEAGDLYLKLNIIIPKLADDEQQKDKQLKAWQDIQDLYHDFKPDR